MTSGMQNALLLALTSKSVPVTSDLESDLVTIMLGVDKASMPPFMKLFWDEQ